MVTGWAEVIDAQANLHHKKANGRKIRRGRNTEVKKKRRECGREATPEFGPGRCPWSVTQTIAVPS
jgi:hypothetical protein